MCKMSRDDKDEKDRNDVWLLSRNRTAGKNNIQCLPSQNRACEMSSIKNEDKNVIDECCLSGKSATVNHLITANIDQQQNLQQCNQEVDRTSV